VNTMTVPLLLVVAYLAARRYWPYKTRRRCRGTGGRGSPTGRSWRNCPRCGGSAQRSRGGRISRSVLGTTTVLR
jgi:hypothetical protein